MPVHCCNSMTVGVMPPWHAGPYNTQPAVSCACCCSFIELQTLACVLRHCIQGGTLPPIRQWVHTERAPRGASQCMQTVLGTRPPCHRAAPQRMQPVWVTHPPASVGSGPSGCEFVSTVGLTVSYISLVLGWNGRARMCRPGDRSCRSYMPT